MGGRNAAFFAAGHRARAAALVLVDYTPSNAPAGSARTAQRVGGTPDSFPDIEAAMDYFGAAPGARPRFEAVLATLPGGGVALKRDPYFRDQFRRLLETGERPKLGADLWQVLAQVTAPTLVIRGARSDLFGADSVERMRRELPALRLVDIDAGHDIPGDNPEGLLRETRAFLGQERI
jgi:pimeloyl-ACP methyl ester carboxylesterase